MEEDRIALLGLGTELANSIKEQWPSATQRRTLTLGDETVSVFGYETVSRDEREALAKMRSIAVVLTDTLEAAYEPIGQFPLVVVGAPHDELEIATALRSLTGKHPRFVDFFSANVETRSTSWQDPATFSAMVATHFDALAWPGRMKDAVVQGAEELCNVVKRCGYQKQGVDDTSVFWDEQRFGIVLTCEGAEKCLENVLAALRIAVRDLSNQQSPMQGLSLAVFSAWSTASSLVAIREPTGEFRLGVIWRKAPSYRDFSKRTKSIFFWG